jgi:hypothetical protein
MLTTFHTTCLPHFYHAFPLQTIIHMFSSLLPHGLLVYIVTFCILVLYFVFNNKDYHNYSTLTSKADL